MLVREYRAWPLKPNEIEHPRVIHNGALTLRGYSIEGMQRQSGLLTVLLFWKGTSANPDTVFVHLIGAMNPVTGTPLWTQDDHPPLLASQAARDVYSLDLTGVAPGDYTVEIGFYDPTNGKRRSLTDQNGESLGESVTLETVHISASR